MQPTQTTNINDSQPTEVEVCSGEGNLSRALRDCNLRVKAFDESWMHDLNKVVLEPLLNLLKSPMKKLHFWECQCSKMTVFQKQHSDPLFTEPRLTADNGIYRNTCCRSLSCIERMRLQFNSYSSCIVLAKQVRWEIYGEADCSSWHLHVPRGYFWPLVGFFGWSLWLNCWLTNFCW